jgi:ABC-type lipoprotein release transport system permease subunit
MLSRWATYLRLGLLDLVRLWPTTQHHVIIVAGISLPILLLLGLKRGHVAELRQALLTSPTGRRIIFGSGTQGALLTPEAVKQLEKELPAVEVIIPDEFRVVALRAAGQDGLPRTVQGVTLTATRDPDPLLSHLGATLPRPEGREIALARAVADKLGAGAGTAVQVTVTRRLGAREESASVEMKVTSVIDTGEQGDLRAFADVGVLDKFSSWVQGFRIADYGWPAGGDQPRPMYKSWLAFCEKGRDFTDEDRKELEFTYRVADISKSPPAVLGRLFKPGRLAELRVYQFTARKPGEDLDDPNRPGVYDPETTAADEVVVPWNEPLTERVAGRPWTLVGLSLRRSRWLRGHFRDEAVPPAAGEDPFRVRVVEGPAAPEGKVPWPLRGGGRLPLEPIREKPAAAADTLAVVPAEVLAWLTRQREGRLDFDPASRLFTRPAAPPLYNRARLYARTIDDVPALVEALWQRDFSVTAEQARIREIHRQDASLQLLVLVVGAGVFVFGVITVVSVLLDSTDRKRGTIGILRVMGTSRAGIFLLIFFRAAVIGLLATVLCAVLGLLLALALGSPALTWKPAVAVDLQPRDFLVVGAGALACCAAGALWPAWRASRLDPFDAIVEGRFR